MNKSDEISLAGGLNSNFLEYLELNLVFEELNGHLLSPHIFKSIKTLQITGKLLKQFLKSGNYVADDKKGNSDLICQHLPS